MAFIGVQPTSIPLTSSDITDGIISTAKIADDAVTSAKIPANAVTDSELNLGSDYAFTGTVSGTPTSRKLLRTITISSNTNSISFVHGANGVVLDSTYSRYEITVDSAVPSATDAPQLILLVSTNGGSSYHTTDAYNSTYHRHYSNGSTTGNDSAYVNDFALNHDQGVSATANNGGATGTIIVDNLGTASRTVFNGNFFGFGASSYYIHSNSIGALASTAIVNAIAIAFTNGDIASAKFKLFGVL